MCYDIFTKKYFLKYKYTHQPLAAITAEKQNKNKKTKNKKQKQKPKTTKNKKQKDGYAR